MALWEPRARTGSGGRLRGPGSAWRRGTVPRARRAARGRNTRPRGAPSPGRWASRAGTPEPAMPTEDEAQLTLTNRLVAAAGAAVAAAVVVNPLDVIKVGRGDGL